MKHSIPVQIHEDNLLSNYEQFLVKHVKFKKKNNFFCCDLCCVPEWLGLKRFVTHVLKRHNVILCRKQKLAVYNEPKKCFMCQKAYSNKYFIYSAPFQGLEYKLVLVNCLCNNMI